MIPLLLYAVLAQSPDTPSSVVSGRVVDAGTLRPIAGVVVSPAGTAVPPPPSPIDRDVLARTLTNGEGRFVIRGLRAGSLVLMATKGGYADATYGQRRPGGTRLSERRVDVSALGRDEDDRAVVKATNRELPASIGQCARTLGSALRRASERHDDGADNRASCGRVDDAARDD